MACRYHIVLYYTVLYCTVRAGGVGGAFSKAPTTDAGWEEVVRKRKKLSVSVSVPSKAIGRVIGCGGSNIDAIQELSGAHIEVERKGLGDRTILIKGSVDATRLANQWISAIIASPDKDLADIVGRAQYKQLSAATISKAAVKTQAAAGADKQEEKGARGAKVAGGGRGLKSVTQNESKDRFPVKLVIAAESQADQRPMLPTENRFTEVSKARKSVSLRESGTKHYNSVRRSGDTGAGPADVRPHQKQIEAAVKTEESKRQAAEKGGGQAGGQAAAGTAVAIKEQLQHLRDLSTENNLSYADIAKKKPLRGFNNPLNQLKIEVKPKGQAAKKVPLGMCKEIERTMSQ